MAFDSVGFIGIGNMGWWMARNLRRSLPREQILFNIYDIQPAILEKFVSEFSDGHNDIAVCTSCREIAEKSSIVFTIVPEGSDVRKVFLDPSTGLLSGVSGENAAQEAKQKTFIDCSTIDPATSLSVARAVEEAGARFYDAPVSGGTAGAEAATLTFMVGAAPESTHFRETVEPLLKAMGSNIVCVGAPSLGLVAKLSNNYLSGIIAIATSEAMNIGMRHGIDPKVLSECFSRSSGQNWPVPGVSPKAVTSRGYKGGFKVQLMAKDVRLAVEAAHSVGAKIVLGETALEAYKSASVDPSCRDLDSRVVYKWLGGVDPTVKADDDSE
ncbi:hypothetical protein SCHPADRAFT_968696 [Schizopora paradoxa]|uniref:3-hydroxyisobutyrate dehydrogenase n=1 Tax=Schizopora paradoxa TaxID=27342 RepID=A0A0H2S9H9_9AGAM|nr:hypothetical protein SCHPADRAFT_968696 [Schizopora paradoxa]